MKILFAFLISVVLIAPHTLRAELLKDERAVTKSLKHDLDKYSKIETWSTARVPIKGVRGGFGILSAITNPNETGAPIFMLMIITVNNSWLFLEKARDSDDREFIPQNNPAQQRIVGSGGSVSEQLIFYLPADYVLKRGINGLDWRIEGQHGNAFVKIPAYYFQALMRTVLLEPTPTPK